MRPDMSQLLCALHRSELFVPLEVIVVILVHDLLETFDLWKLTAK